MPAVGAAGHAARYCGKRRSRRGMSRSEAWARAEFWTRVLG
ncbi:MAG: hypothetical protein ACN6O0_21890 [Achromobacter spanius]